MIVKSPSIELDYSCVMYLSWQCMIEGCLMEASACS